MSARPSHLPSFTPVFGFLAVLFVTACTSSVQDYPTSPVTQAPVDLSGHWELNYGRSDQVNDRLQSLAREYRREQERQQRRTELDRRRGGPVFGSTPGRSFNSVLATARLADMITRSQTIEIAQQNPLVTVHREDDFSLVCDFTEAGEELVEDSLGTESCHWVGDDLVYATRLPDGLHINYRFTLAPDTEQLRIATTVNAAGVAPFTLNKFYYRYKPLPQNFSCKFTLSRGQVCSKVGNK